jgi:hypothetical protein
MELRRRGFLKVTSGLALGLSNLDGALAQRRDDVKGELQAGSGTLFLEGKLNSGTLTLEAQDFLDRADHSVVVRGKLKSTELYSAMFSYQNDRTAFALFHDNDHSTTVVLSNTDDEKIGRLVVWNDNDTPQIFNVDKNSIMATDDPKNIKDVSGKNPDLVGKRKPPAFTWQELERVFGSEPALGAFMRGRKTTHHPPPEIAVLEWICRLLSLVPGSTLSLFWLGR